MRLFGYIDCLSASLYLYIIYSVRTFAAVKSVVTNMFC